MGHTRPPVPSRTLESTDADTSGVLGLGLTPDFKRTKYQKFCEEFVSIMDHFNVFFVNIAASFVDSLLDSLTGPMSTASTNPPVF